MKDHLLIVGTSSSLGQVLASHFVRENLCLFGTYNSNYPTNPECYEKLFEVNFLDKKHLETLNDIIPYVSDIIFTIGNTERLDPEKAKQNYQIIKNLIEYLNIHPNRPRLVYCSSSAIYGNTVENIVVEDTQKNPKNIYGQSKLDSEGLVRSSYSNYIILRFPIVFGQNFKSKFLRLKQAVLQKKAMIFGNGLNNFPYIHETDLVCAILNLIRNQKLFKTDFNLASGSVSQEELMCKIYGYLGPDTPLKLTIKNALHLADNELLEYKQSGVKPSIYREDIESFSRDRIFNCDKAKNFLNWLPKKTFDSCIKDTFSGLKKMSRAEGLRALKYIFPDKTLPLKIYWNKSEFNQSDFQSLPDDYVWSVTIRDEEGDIVNTNHLFSRDISKIIDFINKHSVPGKIFIVRQSPSKNKIKYYGSYLIDKKHFNDKVIITLSKSDNSKFTYEERTLSFILLPRDLPTDIYLECVNGEIRTNDSEIIPYTKELERDIMRVINYLNKTHKDNYAIPLLFIISESKGVEYISMGF